jgi:hypothetical protein
MKQASLSYRGFKSLGVRALPLSNPKGLPLVLFLVVYFVYSACLKGSRKEALKRLF